MNADICQECGGPRHAGWGAYDDSNGKLPPDFNDPKQGPPKCYRCTVGYTAQEIRNRPHVARRGIRKVRGAK